MWQGLPVPDGSEGVVRGPAAPVPSLHRAARVEDAVHEFLEPRMRQRGWRDTVVAYAGYGSPSWVRVMARLLLRKPEQRPARVHAVRGWRSFATLPVTDEVVVVEIGDRRHELRTDRGAEGVDFLPDRRNRQTAFAGDRYFRGNFSLRWRRAPDARLPRP